MLYRRAVGELDEMESSKALCDIIAPNYESGKTVLDVGCGAGHYLRSLRERVDGDIRYSGIDATEGYIRLAKKAFPDVDSFSVGDIFDIDFGDASFDIVMCNNLILHLPPPPKVPLSELIRVAKETVIIRTLVGERNYIVKELRTHDESMSRESQEEEGYKESDVIASDGSTENFNYFNMYTESYLREVIEEIDSSIDLSFHDDQWEDFDNTVHGGKTATRVVNGQQVSGNMLLNWKFLVLKK